MRSPLWSKEGRKDRNGTSKNCRRRYLETAEEDYQEEAREKKEGKKEKKAQEANKGRGKRDDWRSDQKLSEEGFGIMLKKRK